MYNDFKISSQNISIFIYNIKINRSGIQQSPYGRCETKHTYNTNRYKNACRYTTGKYDIYEKVN